MTKHILDLFDLPAPGQPAVSNNRAFRPATRSSVHTAINQQNHAPGAARRTLARTGMMGQNVYSVGYQDPRTPADPDKERLYPDDSTERVLAEQSNVPLTPGCVPRCYILAAYSGPSQQDPGAEPPFDGFSVSTYTGQIILECVWDNGVTTATVRSSVSIAPGNTTFGRAGNGLGTAFAGLREFELVNVPPGMYVFPDEIEKWSGPGVTVDIKILAVAGVRPIDIHVREDPFRVGGEDSGTDTDWPPCHVYSQGWSRAGSFPYEYPIDGNSGAGDRRFGAEHVIHTAIGTGRQLGPAIFEFSWRNSNPYDDWTADGGPTLEEGWLVVGAAGIFHVLGHTGLDETDIPNAPGFSIASGAYGREYRTSGSEHIMPTSGVVPVYIAIKVANFSSPVATVRIQVDPWSYIDVDVSDGWNYATGHLVCGSHPQECKRGWVLYRLEDEDATHAVEFVGIYHLARTNDTTTL